MKHLDRLPPRSQVVAEALIAVGVGVDIQEMPDSTRTAVEAAAAIGCEVGAIASSLVFICDGRPLLVLTSGQHRVDTVALAARLGRGAIERATAEQVREATGQTIGGVAPVGHPAPIETVVDSTLAEYDQVWAAGGTPHTVFPTTYEQLLAVTGGRSTTVTA